MACSEFNFFSILISYFKWFSHLSKLFRKYTYLVFEYNIGKKLDYLAYLTKVQTAFRVLQSNFEKVIAKKGKYTHSSIILKSKKRLPKWMPTIS